MLQNSEYVSKRLVYVEDNAGKDAWKRFMQDVGQTNLMMANIGVPRLDYDVKDAAAINKLSDQQKKDAIDRGYYVVNGHRLFLTTDAYLKFSADLNEDIAGFAYCLSKKEDAEELYKFYSSHPEYKLNSGDNPNAWQSNFNTAWKVLSTVSGLGFVDFIENKTDQIEQAKIIQAISADEGAKRSIAEARVRADSWVISAATGVKASTTDIIANLGQFFKQSAYVYTTEEVEDESGGKKEVVTGWRASKVSVTGALLYAIFLFQSCMYFITYVKRLFFVIMLSMFGPLVVIYDFFMKSAAG